jgi:hypothetical protein
MINKILDVVCGRSTVYRTNNALVIMIIEDRFGGRDIMIDVDETLSS